MNTDLMTPGDTQPKVSPVAVMTAPLPIVKAKKTAHYHLSVPTASMHRADGKKLGFVNGILATDDAHDQNYLENEILSGNSYLRHADATEIEDHNMRINPRGTMRDSIKAELEPELRTTLEVEILAKLQAEGRLVATPSDGAKLGGVDSGSTTPVHGDIHGANFRASIVSSVNVADATQVAGVTKATGIAAKLAALTAGKK